MDAAEKHQLKFQLHMRAGDVVSLTRKLRKSQNLRVRMGRTPSTSQFLTHRPEVRFLPLVHGITLFARGVQTQEGRRSIAPNVKYSITAESADACQTCQRGGGKYPMKRSGDREKGGVTKNGDPLQQTTKYKQNCKLFPFQH